MPIKSGPFANSSDAEGSKFPGGTVTDTDHYHVPGRGSLTFFLPMSFGLADRETFSVRLLPKVPLYEHYASGFSWTIVSEWESNPSVVRPVHTHYSMDFLPCSPGGVVSPRINSTELIDGQVDMILPTPFSPVGPWVSPHLAIVSASFGTEML